MGFVLPCTFIVLLCQSVMDIFTWHKNTLGESEYLAVTIAVSKCAVKTITQIKVSRVRLIDKHLEIYMRVELGGLVLSVLAIRPNARRFKPCRR